jgi:hypothetical protein
MPDSRTSRYPVAGCPLVPSVLADWFQTAIRKPVTTTQLFERFDQLDDSSWFQLEQSDLFNLADQVQGRAQRQVYSEIPESSLDRPVILGAAPMRLEGLPWSTRARKWLMATGAWEDPKQLKSVKLGQLFNQKGLGLSSVLEILVILEGLSGRSGQDDVGEVETAEEADASRYSTATVSARSQRAPVPDRPLFPTWLKPALDKVPGGIPAVVYHSSCWQTLGEELCQRIHFQGLQWLGENWESISDEVLPAWPRSGALEFNRRTLTTLQAANWLERLESGDRFTFGDLQRVPDLGMRGVVDVLSELEWVNDGCVDGQANPLAPSGDDAAMPTPQEIWKQRAVGHAVILDQRDQELVEQALQLPDLDSLGPMDPRFGAAFRIATRDCSNVAEFLRRAIDGEAVFASEEAWQEYGRHLLRDIIDADEMTPEGELASMITAALPRERARDVVMGYFGLDGNGPQRMAQLAERDDTTVQYISGILDRASHEITEAQPVFLPVLSRVREVQVPAQGMEASDLAAELAKKGIEVSADLLLTLPDMSNRLGISTGLNVLDKHAGLLSSGQEGAEHSRQIRLAIARVLRRHGVVTREDLHSELLNLGVPQEQISLQDIARGLDVLGTDGKWVFNPDWSSKRLDTRIQRMAAVAETVPVSLLHGQVARDLQLRSMLPPAAVLAQYVVARGFAALEENDEVVRFATDQTDLEILSPSEKVLLEILNERGGVTSRAEVQAAWEEREMGWALLNNLGSYSAIIAHIPGGNWALVGHPEAARAAVFRSLSSPDEMVVEDGDLTITPVAPATPATPAAASAAGVASPSPQPAAQSEPAAAPRVELDSAMEAPAYDHQTVGFATQALRTDFDSEAVLAMRWHERGDMVLVLHGGSVLDANAELTLPDDLLPHVKNARTFTHPRGEGAAIRLRRGVLELRAFAAEMHSQDGDVIVLQLWPSERTWKASVARGVASYAN